MVRSLTGKHALYFEATLQLRLINKEIIDYVENQFRKAHIPIVDSGEVKNGMDYKVADKRFTRALGKKLRQRYGGQVKETATLHTKIKGKDAYRVTVLYRMANFRRGDKVMFHGERFEVLSMAKEIVLRGLDDRQKLRVKYELMKKVTKIEEENLTES